MKKSYSIILLLLTLFLISNTEAQSDPQLWDYPTDQTYPLAGHHRDVLGKMFPVTGSGTLDTFYFQIGNISSISPQVKIRIFKSKVGPHTGPGFGSYAGGCQNWGYYNNTHDPDQGITPFKDAATDTHWVSTIGGATPSFSPLGNEIWGMGGFLITLVPNSINKVALDVLGSPLSVTGGDSIFVTMEIVRSGGHIDDPPNGFDATWVDQSIAPKEESESLVQTGIWKFYEHDVGTSFSNVSPIKGWRYLTGGVDNVSLPGDSIVLRPKKPFLQWWFALHPTANVPPKIKTLSRVYNTLSTGSQTVQSEIVDLNGADSSSAGVKSAWVRSDLSGGGWSVFDSARVSMVHTGPGNIWQGTIPGQPAGSMVSYWVEAVDSQGLFARTLPVTYQILDTRTDYYYVDTTDTSGQPVPGAILIPTSSFFLPPGNYQDRPAATDNGTAGPFDLGGPFAFFGYPVPLDTVYRYAWIGVDGAIALSAIPTDTQHVNSNGYFGALWDYPINGDRDMPKQIIAPFYKDLLLSDSSGTYGAIRYKMDSARFIVEWDSLEARGTPPIMSKTQPHFGPMGTAQVRPILSLILNRKEGTVEFHYNNMPFDANVWHRTLVGMQGEVSTPYSSRNWSCVNKGGYPTELQPRSNRSFKFWPVLATPVQAGWNLLSAGVVPQSPLKSFLYPDATSSAFIYEGSYVPKDSVTHGPGFWLKFNGASTAQVPGSFIDSLGVAVSKGWNIVGSLSTPIPVASITSTPPGLVTSSFYGYSNGYASRSVIEPGTACWAKVDSSGILWLRSSGSANSANRIRIQSTSELPPPPPEQVSTQSGDLPKEYALAQNYPNPFNPSTSIKYQLPVDSRVTLKIYNVLGQTVKTMVDGVESAGFKMAQWDASRLGSGIYFYRIDAVSLSDPSRVFMQAKKMMLIK